MEPIRDYRYDVESIQQKQMEIEQTLTDTMHQVNETKALLTKIYQQKEKIFI